MRITNFKEFNGNHDDLPSLIDYISNGAILNKEFILHYLKHFEPTAVSPSYVYDFVERKGTSIELMCYSDGKYTWPSDEIYHFEKYNIPLDEHFVASLIEIN